MRPGETQVTLLIATQTVRAEMMEVTTGRPFTQFATLASNPSATILWRRKLPSVCGTLKLYSPDGQFCSH